MDANQEYPENEVKQKWQKTIQGIKTNYLQQEKALVAELFMGVDHHGTTVGSHRENIWKSLFEQIVPKKFSIEQGVFLIDSKGNISREVDLAIFDEQYIPYVFKNRNIKYIPVEAVMAVVQCKSTQYEADKIQEWEESIDRLAPVTSGIAGSAHNKIIKNGDRVIRPLKILCGLFSALSEENIDKWRHRKSGCHFIIHARSEEHSLAIHHKSGALREIVGEITPALPEGDQISGVLPAVYRGEISDSGEISVLTLMLQLNQLLIFINNPMLFPHQAYAEMFNCPEFNIQEAQS